MQPAERYHAFDALRAVALLLGIVLHAAASFVPRNPNWAIVDHSTHPFMLLLVFVIHIFRLAAFFLMAGFFGRLVCDRKGEACFVRDRLKRILLPLAAGWCVLFPLIMTVWIWGAQRSGGGFLPREAWNVPAPLVAVSGIVRGEVFKGGFRLAHLWFLYYLLMMYVLVLAGRRLWPRRMAPDGFIRAVVNHPLGILALAAPAALVLSLAPHRFGVPTPDRTLAPEWMPLAAYGSFFVCGWLLHRQPGLLEVLKRRWIPYLALAALFTAAAMAAAGRPGGRWVYAVSYALAMWSWVFGLAGLFLRFLSAASAAWRYLSDSSYWLYLAHLPLVVFLQVAMARLAWPWSVKFALILGVSLAVLLVSYDFFVRGTFVGAVLNGRRRPRIFPALQAATATPNPASASTAK